MYIMWLLTWPLYLVSGLAFFYFEGLVFVSLYLQYI